MNVKKGVSAPRKGQTSLPQTLAHVIFFHIFFTQASTPSLRGPAMIYGFSIILAKYRCYGIFLHTIYKMKNRKMGSNKPIIL